VALDALNRTLQPHGIFLPVIPGSHRAASIGGMLATNAAGLHAVHYGKMGDWVEQITLVDGCGQIRNLAGAASEDAVGREGVTGFIVRAVLRLTPRPVKRTLSLRIFTDITGLLSARAELLLNERLTAMEYVNPHAAAAIGWNARHYLLIEFDGAGGDIEHPTQMAALWQARDHLYPRLAQYGYPVIEDPQISGDGQAHLLDWMDLHEIPAFGHLGMGIIHPCFRPDDRRVSNLYTLTAEYGGCVSGEHGIGLKKKSWVGVPYQAEIARLKQIYDPQKILNRGKLC
jgi:glycolate oxidase